MTLGVKKNFSHGFSRMTRIRTGRFLQGWKGYKG
jgi:hypothetical protein